MRVQEIMTRDPACCTPQDTAERAATLMREHDCGAVPVIDDQDGRHVVGVVTDRDLAVRGLAQGRDHDARVEEMMTSDPSCCSEDDEVDEVERVMAEHQVRRVPIIDADGRLVGIVAQADLALQDDATSDEEVGEVVERISQPDRKVRPASAD